VWVLFSRNLGERDSTVDGAYAGMHQLLPMLKASSLAADWKAIMGFEWASPAAMAASLQAMPRYRAGILLVLGRLDEAVARQRSCLPGQSFGISGVGTSWILGIAGSGSLHRWGGGGTRRPCLGGN